MGRDRVIAVTGANGYIGSHVVKVLLARGYRVRAGVRLPHSEERVSHLRKLPLQAGGSLEVVATDVLDLDAVNALLDGCTDLIHTAATVMIRSSDPQKKILSPSLDGTKNVISALNKHQSIERVVHTSSTAAIRPMKWESGATLSSEVWADDATLEKNPYGLAKVLAEREIRKWHNDIGSKQGRMLKTIHPCMVFGPPLSRVHLRGSLTIMMMLARRSIPAIIPMNINIVDVRDVAESHVRALDMGEDGGRYLVTSGSMWMKEVVAVLRKSYPEHRWPRIPIPYPLALLAAGIHPAASISWARTHLGTVLNWDSNPAKRDLGMSWMEPSTSVVDTFEPIFESKWL